MTRPRNLRTERDNQQWMLDLALNTRGRVQNFERDFPEVPPGKRARNYRMLPKVWRQEAEHQEALARMAASKGFHATATKHFDEAIEAYRMAQHPIFYDDNPIKQYLWGKVDQMVDLRSQVAPYPIERVEVPFEGSTISCLLHLLPDRRRAPCVIYVPGMDQSKEVFPLHTTNNPALPRGMHVLAMDGPGQGSSNLKKIRAVGDAYERAGAAVIGHIAARDEIDEQRIALYGISMGSYWSLRLANHDDRVAAVASAVACFNPNHTIFTQSSPRFKQMFMYMAGMDDEAEFDEMARGMTVRGQLGRIACPTLLATGEFDPLCPLEDAIEAYEELRSPKELWVFEDQYHPLMRLKNLGGLNLHDYTLDWLQQTLMGEVVNRGRVVYVRADGSGPFDDGALWEAPVGPGQAYF
ncbi:MAG: alpha/beta fold hydrolase [Chloroflexi bacterium]|nr:alpha/beta fold hydrolase [Chloroflexota bacterium]